MIQSTPVRIARSASRLATAVAAFTIAAIAPGQAAAQAPKRGGTLSVAIELTTGSLDPLFGNAQSVDRNFYNLFAENLVHQNARFEFEPWLAESWQAENDGKSYTFRLRRGVTFQDGTPFNAAAVKFNIERLMDPKVPHTQKAAAETFESVDVIDEHTVRINFKAKSAVSLSRLANQPGAMLSPKAIQERGVDFGRSPVGTGPFEIVSWSGSQFVAKRYAQYWQKDASGQPLPYLDGVDIKVIPNSAIRLVELRSGNAQLTNSIQPKDFEQVRKAPGLRLLETGLGSHQHLAYNVTRPPFDNLDLRKAISLGIDRAALVKVVAPNDAIVLKTFEVPKSSWVFDDAVPGHEYDPEQARQLYAKSGHKGPITMIMIQRDPDVQVSQLIQGMLKRIGIEIRIEMLERQAYTSKIIAHQNEFALQRFAHLGPDPDYTYTALYDKRGFYDLTGYDRTQTTELVARARAESDREKRRAIYNDINRTTVGNHYFSWLFWLPVNSAASQRLQGIQNDATGSWMYTRMWLQN